MGCDYIRQRNTNSNVEMCLLDYLERPGPTHSILGMVKYESPLHYSINFMLPGFRIILLTRALPD